MYSLSLHSVDVTGQFHVPAAPLPVYNLYKAGRATVDLDTLVAKKNIFAPDGNLIPVVTLLAY
jgi:hypothetical protein